MGGGDLNLKKSWHPNTIKNQEKVWKAEQAKASEKKRIDDLRREIDNERSKEELIHHGQMSGVLSQKDTKKIDWMYKQPNQDIDHEEYLLGKKIDKTFEKIVSEKSNHLQSSQKNHVEHECIPFSIRNLSTDTTSREFQVDMARKMMEDPLVAIRQRELESRSRLLQNPVKLKELTTLLKNEQLKKKKKKDKKLKKSVDNIDKQLAEKLKYYESKNMDLKDLLSKKKSKKKRRNSSSSNESDESTDRKSQKKRSKKDCDESKYMSSISSKTEYKHSKKDSDDSKYTSSISSKTEYKRSKKDCDESKYKSSLSSKTEYKHKHENETHATTNHDTDDEQPSISKNYGLVRADGSKIELKRTHRDKDHRQHVEHEKKVKYEKPRAKSQLSEAEKEKKRKEMMDNATARDRERERNVSYYKEQDRRQDAEEKKHGYRDGFVEKQMRETSKHLSVESRIKSNIYNIQRSHRHMDSHFAKR